MSDDGGWGFDPFLGLLIGALLFSNRRPDGPQEQGHQHGDHWHTHVLPDGRHVHDGGLNGPIRIVPPTEGELAEEARRRARSQEGWAIIGGVVGVLFLVGGSVWWGLGIIALSALLSPSVRVLFADLEEVEARADTDPRPFVVSHVDVRGDADGRTVIELAGWSQVSATVVLVTAEVHRGQQRVSHAAGHLHDLIAGQAVTLTLHGLDRYTGHDRVIVDSKEVTST